MIEEADTELGRKIMTLPAGKGQAAVAELIADYRWRCERAEARKCWDMITAAIQIGPQPGNGTDKTAQNNGLILATNIIFDRAYWDRDKPQVGGSPTP